MCRWVAADVLVIPRRVIPRFADLTPAEVGGPGAGLGSGRATREAGLTRLAPQVTDLFMSAQMIGKVVEKHYNGQYVAPHPLEPRS